MHEDEILVLKYQGPKGAPGMPETHIPPIFYAKGLSDMLIITDGRTSGSTKGPMVLHITPEAADGGPIAIVEEGDEIRIDIENRKLDLLVSEEEIARRLKSWVRPDQGNDPFVRGWIKQYVASVGSASKGAPVELFFT